MKLPKRLLCVVVMTVFFAIGNNASAAGFVFAKNLTLGSRGGEVSALQQILIDGGLLGIAAPTGYFGPATKRALGVWQKSMGISPAVGYFGSISRSRMNAMVAQVPVIPVPIEIATTTIAIGTTTVSGGIPAILVGTTTIPAVIAHDGSPVRLTIPKIKVDAGFQYTGLTPEGVMEIPNNIFDIGWYTGSPRPGERGASVITGHVAQIRGGVLVKEGVFNDLNMVRPGDTLSVLNDKGESITFVVRESRSFDPAANASEVFKSTDGRAHMNIITCEGIWNPEKASYSQRLVVFTDAVQ